MRILVIHNYYTDWCGEDVMFESHVRLLRESGHEVAVFVRRNKPVSSGIVGNARAFLSGLGNPCAARDLGRQLDAFHPQVVHAHNVTPMISALALKEVTKRGIPLVMTLHQYRLTCPESHHLRQGRVCTECLGRSGWSCIRHNCLGNIAHSVAHASWHFAGAQLHSMRNLVDAWIVLSDFQKSLMIRAGLAPESLHIVPNWVPPPDGPMTDPGDYFAFVGRVSPEKGVSVLMDAARRLPEVTFRVTGTMDQLAPYVPPANVAPTGWLDAEGVQALYRGARAVVLPSLWYETWGMCVTEAARQGRPAVASSIGGITTSVEDQRTGILVPPGDAAALAQAIRKLHADAALAARMGTCAREKAAREFGPVAQLSQLERVYQSILHTEETPC